MDNKPWQYAVGRVGDVCTVTVSGDVDLDARDELRDVLIDEVTRPGVHRVQVDLSGVGYLGSAGITSLVAAYVAARDADCRFVVVQPPDAVARVLEITGVLPLLRAAQPAPDGEESLG